MTPANITALQALVKADPALAQQLQSATNEVAAQLLTQAASQKGLALDAHAIADYMKTAQTAQMTDAELEAVAGGSGSYRSQDNRSSIRTETVGGKLRCGLDDPFSGR